MAGSLPTAAGKASRQAALGLALVLATTLSVYARTAGHDFISYDDPGYVTANTTVKGGLSAAGIAWALDSTAMSNWHPVTWLSHMVDVQAFGLAPGGHHLVSVALHVLSTLLLFLLLRSLTARPWPSLMVAALFALHPLHVESVAWVAERKDVLSGLLWHLTLLLYVAFVRRRSLGLYLAALATFAVGLMAKPMLVTLPVVLLILDWWPLERFGHGMKAAPAWSSATWKLAGPIWDKAPFLLLSLLSATVTIWAQHRGGSLVTFRSAPLGLRVGNALVSTASYLGLAFSPHGLAVLYPFPPSIPVWQVGLAAGVLVAITAAVVAAAARAPYLAAGWAWFLVTLLPVIGLVQVGAQAMADRYTYLPLTGVFIMVVWGAAELTRPLPPRLVALGAGLVLLVAAGLTWRQLGYWRDSTTLYERTLQVTQGNYLILNNYGATLNDLGRPEEAAQALEQALAIEPLHAEACYNLARIRQVTDHDLDAASDLYRRSISLKPDYLDALINLGGVLNQQGRFAEALRALERARGLAPWPRAELQFNLGVSHVALGDLDQGRRDLAVLQPLDPVLAQQLASYIDRMAPSSGR